MAVERYLKLAEFVERAQIGESTVFQWIKQGKLREGVSTTSDWTGPSGFPSPGAWRPHRGSPGPPAELPQGRAVLPSARTPSPSAPYPCGGRWGQFGLGHLIRPSRSRILLAQT